MNSYKNLILYRSTGLVYYYNLQSNTTQKIIQSNLKLAINSCTFMKQTKSINQNNKDNKKNAFGLTHNHNKTDLQQLDLMCSSLNFANGFHAAKLLNLLKFQIKETLPYIPKNKIIGGKSAKKSKFQKIGTLKSHQNKKQTNQNLIKNQQNLTQFEQNSRNKQISIQYYHQDLKEIQKYSPQKQKKSNFSNSNLSSINSLYHVFKNVQLKISQPADLDFLQQDKNKSKSSQIPNADQFLKSISIKSKLNEKYNKNSSPIDILKQQKNKFPEYLHKNFNEETQPNFFDISKVQLSSKKIQKFNHPHPSSQKHSEKQQQTFKSKGKFQKVQKKSTNKYVNSQSKFSSKDDKNLKTNQNQDQHLKNEIKFNNPAHKQAGNGHKRKSTDDSLQNLHIELQYIHKVKENQQKQKLKQKQKPLHEKDSFNRVLQQEQIDQQYYQTEQYKVLRSTSQLSQKQIYELMSVQGNKYKQIALKNYFKKQKIHNNNQKNQQYKGYQHQHKYPQY